MTRRKGIIAALASVVGAAARTESQGSFVSLGGSISIELYLRDKAGSDTGGFEELIVNYNGQRITLTAREIFEALKGELEANKRG